MVRKGRSVLAGLTGVAGLVTVLAGSGVSSAAPAPVPREQTVSYESFTFDPSDPDVARRLAAGEDPSTIPGVQVRTSEEQGQLAPSSEENERRIAAENYDKGITYEVDSSTLGDK